MLYRKLAVVFKKSIQETYFFATGKHFCLARNFSSLLNVALKLFSFQK